MFQRSTVGCGGIFRAKKVIAIAEAAGLNALLGSTVELGVGTAAQLALASSSWRVDWPSDLIGPLMYTDDVLNEPWEWDNGYLRVPTGPGLGVTLDPANSNRCATTSTRREVSAPAAAQPASLPRVWAVAVISRAYVIPRRAKILLRKEFARGKAAISFAEFAICELALPTRLRLKTSKSRWSLASIVG